MIPAAVALMAAAVAYGDDGGDGGDEGGGGSTLDADVAADSSPEADGSPTACVVGDETRTLVEELVHKALVDLVHTTSATHSGERGFSSQLVGVNQAFIGHVTLISECAGSEEFVPCCEVAQGGAPTEDPFYEDHDKVSRLACEAAGLGTLTMYWTMRPETDPATRHAFAYQTASPLGDAVAAPIHSWSGASI